VQRRTVGIIVILAVGVAAAGGCGVGEPPAPLALTRGPYLQLLTGRTVTVVWRTNRESACSLAIHRLGGPPRVIDGAMDAVCAIEVDGLEPGGRYAYTPRANREALLEESVFRADDPDGAFTFAVVGDTGSGSRTQRAVGHRILASAPHFVLHTGDMVYERGEAERFDQTFFRPYAALLRTAAVWPSLGNHDVRTSDGLPWRDAFYTPANNPEASEGYYSFDFGNAHVVVLDSNDDAEPGSAQHRFLERSLGSTLATWRFVVLHHTLYSGGRYGGDTRLRAALAPVFDRFGVHVVFMGHDHDYERTLPLAGGAPVRGGAGTVYVTTGGGGKSIHRVRGSATTAYAESAYHFVRVAVTGETLRLEMVRHDGAVRDATTLVATPGGARGDA
jgi:hypothetical protein